MGRNDYQYIRMTPVKGVNQQDDIASMEECADALNLWAPNGQIEQRPGIEGQFTIHLEGISTPDQFYLSETAGGAIAAAEEGDTLTLNSWPVGAYWYLGVTDFTGLGTPEDQELNGVVITLTNSNSSGVLFKSEYWNGTEWRYLRVSEYAGTGVGAPDNHLGGASFSFLTFVPPGDWATKAIAATTNTGGGSHSGTTYTKYWIRFKLVNAGATTLDGSVALSNISGTTHSVSPTAKDSSVDTQIRIRGFFSLQFPSRKRYVAIRHAPPYTYYEIGSTPDFEDKDVSSINWNLDDSGPASIAVVPQFGEAYIAFSGQVSVHRADRGYNDTYVGDHRAAIEDRDFAVGENAYYDPDLIGTLPAYPAARFIAFYKNRLWVAGISDEPFTIRWSATAPFHRVWPTLSAQPVMEDDNSPISGLYGLGESMVVFKSDSIWNMVSIGENPATGVEHYLPIRMVAGTGCVSNASIASVQGSLIFLAEDGVYAFNGTPSVQKLSDRVQKTIDSITPGRRPYSVATHWKAKNCYLLSIPVDGSNDNNRTLVYDYKNDAWWIWDIGATLWMNDEDGYDNERIYFVDHKARVYELGPGNSDHGAAISSYFVSQRVGLKSNIKRTLRHIEVIGNNDTTSLTVSVRSNDDEQNEVSGSLDLTDSGEVTYGNATTSSKYVLARRRSRRLAFRETADWFQIKVAHDVKHAPMRISAVEAGFLDHGRR